MSGKFSGYYFKHQKNGQTVAFIPGISDDSAFIQIITDQRSLCFEFPSGKIRGEIQIGKCRFSTEGVHIDLPGIHGDVLYSNVTPLKADIMGPFRFVPMECRHKIVSMRHRLSGSLTIDNMVYDFDDGIGYIEGDSGRSFPRKYIWLQANDFVDNSSVMISVADIPFCGLRFEGCICVIIKDGNEYRLATYLGAKTEIKDNTIKVCQGRHLLIADIKSDGGGFSLVSPINGKMNGITKENNNAEVSYRLFSKGKTVCELHSSYSGFECFGYSLSRNMSNV